MFKSSVSQFMTVIYSMEYDEEGNDAGKDTGEVAGKDTGIVGRPDMYVFQLLKVVGSQTLSVKSMMKMLGLKGADNFRKKYLTPAIKDGYMAFLYPDKPRSKGQAYYLTEKGLEVVE